MMKTTRSLWSVARRYPIMTVAAVALAAATGLVAVARAQTDQANKPGRVLLDEDLAKLAIVVMANQTPVTQADAQAVLPILEEMQEQRGEPGTEGQRLDDATAADLDAQLRAALSPTLLAAVDVVRLLTPSAPPGPAGQHPRSGAGGGGTGTDMPGPHMGRGPRGGHGPGGPRGPMGPWLLGPLVDFFTTTAAG